MIKKKMQEALNSTISSAPQNFGDGHGRETNLAQGAHANTSAPKGEYPVPSVSSLSNQTIVIR